MGKRDLSWDLSGICPGFVWDLSGICLGFGLDL